LKYSRHCLIRTFLFFLMALFVIANEKAYCRERDISYSYFKQLVREERVQDSRSGPIP
jgi:hypothetical protein